MLDSQLLRYNLKDRKILSIDAETNGLHHFYSLPFNVAMNVYQNNKLIESNDLYIKWPNYKMNSEVALKTHYDPKKIESVGLEPVDFFKILKKYLDNEEFLIVGHNYLNYDCMIFKNSASKAGIDVGYKHLNRTYDTNSIFKGYKLGIKPDNNNLLSWQFSMNNWKQRGLKSRVGICCKEFNIEYKDEDAHSALYDIERSYKIFMELIKKVEIC